jgi:hypothetical protein
MFTRHRFIARGAAVPLLASSVSEAGPAATTIRATGTETLSLKGLWLLRLDPGVRASKAAGPP